MAVKKAFTLLSQRTESFTYSHFDHRRQLRRLLLASAMRWFLTVILAIATYAVLYTYSNRGAMVTRVKREFNTLIIGLSILLGLNIASSLKHMVRELRWWVLSLYEWSALEADLIFQTESISRLIQLGWVSRRNWIRLYAVVWVVINVAAQIAVALLGITYNINAADRMTITTPGIVSISDMSDIQTNRVLSNKSQTVSAQRYTANSYGFVGLAYGLGAAEGVPQPGSLYTTDSALFFCLDTSSPGCTYYFYESTPDDLPYYMTVATNRSVSTNSTCESWKVLEGGDGSKSTITIDDGKKTQIAIPAINGPGQTTFMVNPDVDSGPSWSRVAAFEASIDDGWYYVCNVTVGPVLNAVLNEHKLGQNITSLAAAAIALQGYGATNTGVTNNSTKQIQFQSYPVESIYGGAQYGNVSSMAELMSVFCVSVITATSQVNTNIDIMGQVPLKGIELDIESWNYVHMIMGLTVGLQLLFAVISAIVANRVTVRDHSYLAMAAILRPAVQDLSNGGTMTSGKQILAQLGPSVRFSYVPATNGVYYVKIRERSTYVEGQEVQEVQDGHESQDS